MSIYTPTHPEYLLACPHWKEARDCVAGEDAVKQNSTTYLPRPPGIDPDNYELYVRLASFYGATSQAVLGLLGTIIRKPAEVTVPDSIDLDHIGKEGESLQILIKDSLRQNLIVSRLGILVDAFEDGNPYVVFYLAEDILDWQDAYVPYLGRRVPVYVFLREVGSEIDYNTLDRKPALRFRMLYLENGVYHQQVYVPDDDSIDGFIKVKIRKQGESVIPKKSGGRVLNEIPFIFYNANSMTTSIEQPALMPLIKINMSHFRMSADLHWGLHWTALPTPVVSGIPSTEGTSNTPTKLPIGSTKAWCLEPPEARATMLEFTGAGIGSLAKEMDKKERQMAILGSRLLDDSQAANTDVAEAVRLRLAGDSAVLGSITMIASQVWTKVLQLYASWKLPGLSVSEINDIRVSVNMDFSARKMDPQELTMLTHSYISGAIPMAVYYWNLRRGEVIPSEMDFDDFKSQLQQESPLLQQLGLPPPSKSRKNLTKPQVDDEEIQDEASDA